LFENLRLRFERGEENLGRGLSVFYLFENLRLRFERGEENLGRGLSVFYLFENLRLRFERGEENLGRGLSVFYLFENTRKNRKSFYAVEISVFVSRELVPCGLAYPYPVFSLLELGRQPLLRITFRTTRHNHHLLVAETYFFPYVFKGILAHLHFMKNLTEYLRSGDAVYLLDESNNLYYKKTSRSKPLKLSIFQEHFYNLRVFNNIPVLEIDGLRMQVMKGFATPLEYSDAVANALGIRKNARVLDTCAGIGYTALAAARRGAFVKTVEYSNAVLELARYNPLSKGLFESKNIELISGDISEKIKEFETASFDFIIHDPPRISRAPQLYSIDFYRQCKRVLKPKGKIYHYTGSLGAKTRGRNVAAEVSKRLSIASFANIRHIFKLQGLIAVA